MPGDMLARTTFSVVVALVTACGPTRSSGDGDSTSSTSSTTHVDPSTTDPSTTDSSTTHVDSSSESTSSTSSSSETTADLASSSETADVPAPYGPCGACGPDEVEIDGG